MMYLYFEPQQAALCAVHAINTLLQGPYCNEIDLSEIALALDAAERALLGGEAITGEHGNVDTSGMFSMQVVSKYLEDLWDLQSIALRSPEAANAQREPQHEQAFICNLDEHWFTIRNVFGDWYNFNSLFSAPEPLSPFYLSAFLGSLQEQGYSIYVIRGSLPSEPHVDAGQALPGVAGKWFTPEEAAKASKSTQELKKKATLQQTLQNVLDMASAGGTKLSLRSSSAAAGGEGSGTLTGSKRSRKIEADELAEALQLSRQTGLAAGGGADEDADLAAAIAASLADTAPLSGTNNTNNNGSGKDEQGDEEKLADLPELGDEPAEGGSGVLELVIRLPDGSRCQRRFRADETVGHVMAFVCSQENNGVNRRKNKLTLSFPRKVLSDMSESLESAGVENKQLLTIE